jgi:hypothetical protein
MGRHFLILWATAEFIIDAKSCDIPREMSGRGNIHRTKQTGWRSATCEADDFSQGFIKILVHRRVPHHARHFAAHLEINFLGISGAKIIAANGSAIFGTG